VVLVRDGEIAFIKEIPIGTQRFDAEISDKLGVTPAEAQLLRSGLGAERKAAKTKPGTGGGTAVQTQLDASTRQVIVDAVGAVSQELAREISLCFRYYTVTFRGKRVKRAIFAGGGAYENILLNVMRRQLTVEVQVAEPFRGFDLTKFNFENDRRGSLCEWAVAVGLALKRLEE
jgi:type IV pilus assembly protein PilM